MKKTVFYVLILIFSLGTPSALTAKSRHKTESGNVAMQEKKEVKISEEELSQIAKRVEEIRQMDRSKLTAEKKRELRQELREYRERFHREGYRQGGTVIIFGGGGLVLIIVLIILLA